MFAEIERTDFTRKSTMNLLNEFVACFSTWKFFPKVMVRADFVYPCVLDIWRSERSPPSFNFVKYSLKFCCSIYHVYWFHLCYNTSPKMSHKWLHQLKYLSINIRYRMQMTCSPSNGRGRILSYYSSEAFQLFNL